MMQVLFQSRRAFGAFSALIPAMLACVDMPFDFTTCLTLPAVMLPLLCRMYRLVPAASLLQHFASDRSHMRLPDGSWSADPPQYPCIVAADGCCMNLHRYRDMASDVLQDSGQHSITIGAMHGAAAGMAGAPHAGATAAAGSVGAVTLGDMKGDIPAAASGGGGVDSVDDGAGVVLLSWQDVVHAADQSKYGVVLQEETLLRCLMGGG